MSKKSVENANKLINALLDDDIDTIARFIHEDYAWLTYPLYGENTATLLTSLSPKLFEAVDAKLSSKYSKNPLAAMKQLLTNAVKKADTETIKTFAKQNIGWFSLAIDEYPHTVMHLAALSGDVNVINTMIASGANVNQVNNNKDTPLFIAACYDHVDIVDTLLANGADVTKKNNNQDSALLLAAYNGHVDIVTSLLAKGDNVNQATKNNETSLYLAATKGHIKVVEALISNGANVNQANKQGKTPLFNAAENDNEDVVTLLLNSGADVKQEWKGKEALKQKLKTAVKNADLDTIEAFAKQNKGWLALPIDEYPYTLLHLAVFYGNTNVIHLIANRDNVNQNNKNNQYHFSPLQLACYQGNCEVVKLLLDKGANINELDKCGYTPLLRAIEKGNSELVTLLLDREADINQVKKNGETPLYRAVSQGNSEVVELLLDRGADVNKESKRTRETPLFKAAANDRADLVNTLLNFRADVKQEWKGKQALKDALKNAVTNSDLKTIEKFAKQNIGWLSLPLDKRAYTVMHHAAQIGNVTMLNALLKYEIDVNTASDKKYTPLILAANNGHNEVVMQLLASGANVNLNSLFGNNALIFASHANHVEVVKTLLANDANANQINKEGETALGIAATKGYTKIVEELLLAPVADEHKKTALYLAAKQGHLSVFNALLKSGAEFNLGFIKDLNALEDLLASLPEVASICLDGEPILNKLKNASIRDTARIVSTLQPETLREYEKKLYKNSRWDECFNSSKYDGFFQSLGAYLFDDYKAALDKEYYNKVFRKMDDLPNKDRISLSKGHIYAYGLVGQTQNVNKACSYYKNVSNDNPKNRIYALYELASIYLGMPDKNQEYIEIHKELGSCIDTYLKKHPEDGHILAMNAHYSGLECPETLDVFKQANETRLENAKIEYPADETLDKQWNKQGSARAEIASYPNGFLGTLNQKLAKEKVLIEEESDSNRPRIG